MLQVTTRRRLRSGVAEIISVTILILVAVGIGVGFYYTAKSLIDESTRRVMQIIDRAEVRLNEYIIVDAFYVSDNSTLIIYLYTPTGGSVVFDKLYINSTLVPPDKYISGFGEPIKAGTLDRFAAIVSLAPGKTYEILLTSPSGARASAILHVG